MVKIQSHEIQKDILNKTQTTKNKPAKEFDLFLKKEIEQKSKSVSLADISTPQIEFQNLEAALSITQNQEGNNLMNHIETTLKEWEKYSQHLLRGNIKNSKDTLECVIQQISDIEGKMGTGEDNKEIRSVVEELKIMALTEKARLYRGEYI